MQLTFCRQLTKRGREHKIFQPKKWLVSTHQTLMLKSFPASSLCLKFGALLVTPTACFRGSMSVMFVTRHRLQSHSSGIQFVVAVIIVIVIIFVCNVVVVSVKVFRRLELLSHSHEKANNGPQQPLST